MASRQSKVHLQGTLRQGTPQPFTFDHAWPQQHDADWARWLYTSGRPFSITEDRGFIEALRKHDPLYKLSLSAPAGWPVTGSDMWKWKRWSTTSSDPRDI
ncbi:hypothetical protein N7535_008861 [Penicillium sp. DV-2018c]|nr:hypothetical protein N7461_002617 [Penicillium sp. DV-2018c]KAJ5563697.1 hypothetical protein N7535_008861 [Penicillium sp. DV-2018c]